MNYVQKIIIIAFAASATVAAASTPPSVDRDPKKAFENCKNYDVTETSGLVDNCMTANGISCCGLGVRKTQKSDAGQKKIRRSKDGSLLYRKGGTSQWFCILEGKNKSWITGHWHKKRAGFATPKHWTCKN